MSFLRDSKSLDELLEEEGWELEEGSLSDIKEKIRLVDKEMNKVSSLQWTYAKQLLGIGGLAWLFGFSVFIWQLILVEDTGFDILTSGLAISLLIAAGVVPVAVTVFLIQSHRRRVNRLRETKEKLLSRYESTVLGKVEDRLS